MNATNVATFLGIVQGGSFHAAARRLHVSQSTVSARIATLEAELGVALFDRSRRRVRLSEAGRRFVEPAKGVIEALDRAQMAVSDAGSLARPLRIGVVEVIAISWLGRFMAELLARYPSIHPDVTVRPTADLLSLLRADDIDLLLVPETGSGDPERMEGKLAARLGSVEWAVASASSAAQSVDATPAGLAGRRLATLGHGSLIGPAIDGWFRDAGLRPARTISCDSVTALASIVRSGAAAGLVPRSLDGEAAGLVLQGLTPGLPCFRYVALVARPSDRLAVEAAMLAARFSTFERSDANAEPADRPSERSSAARRSRV